MMLSSIAQRRYLFFFSMAIVCLSFSSVSVAQESAVLAEEVSIDPVQTPVENKDIEDMFVRINLVAPTVRPSQIPSLFFTTWEQSLLAEARRGLNARKPTDYEVDKAQREAENEEAPPAGPRELSLGGIIFVSSEEWTIWLNAQKITQKRIPPEILDIQVEKDYVHLKWFDAYTNQIFPIKLKTHQRFNIDTRIFLPG